MNKRRRYKAKRRRSQAKANLIMKIRHDKKIETHARNYAMGPDNFLDLFK